MTQIEKFERWAEKQEWFLFRKGATWIKYVLSTGRIVGVYFTDDGTILRIEDD